MSPAERIAAWRAEFIRVNGEAPPTAVYDRGWYRVGGYRGPFSWAWRASDIEAATSRLRARPEFARIEREAGE
jgi:hypothetical protein